MTDDAQAVRKVWMWVRQYDKGFFCPAVMWGMVIDVLDDSDPSRILGQTSTECQAALRRIYLDRPLSLHGLGCDETSWRLVAAVERWCLALDAEPIAVPYHVGTQAEEHHPPRSGDSR